MITFQWRHSLRGEIFFINQWIKELIKIFLLVKNVCHVTPPFALSGCNPGPLIACYNASAVKIYNTINCQMHFENESTFLHFKKRQLQMQRS
jgi:hypothetical protein